MPTWLVKQHLPALIQILCRIVNCSLSSGVFPAELRKARITPVLKPSLDTRQLTSYRPASNLSFLGKLIEKVVSSQVASFVKSNDLSEPLQSAYRPYHSTETALLTVQDAFFRAIDSHQAVFLIMVDLSAAFDTVDHNILLQRLTGDFGLDGVVHQWFHTYLSDRSSQVCVKDTLSTEAKLKYGVPQGSVIGPQMFTYYSHTIGQLIRRHSIQYNMYADDVQLFLTFNPSRPGDAACALFRLSRCVNELQSWLVTNKLKMNPDKTEFFIAPLISMALKFILLHLSETWV